MVRRCSVITCSMLTIRKSLKLCLVMCIIIATFVAHLRGSRLRRGTTRERLSVDLGRFITACKFDLHRGTRDLSPSVLLFLYSRYHHDALL